jgi:hypothetical protein
MQAQERCVHAVSLKRAGLMKVPHWLQSAIKCSGKQLARIAPLRIRIRHEHRY